MSTIKRIVKAVTHPKLIGQVLVERNAEHFKNDKRYLNLVYWLRGGQKLNFDNPRTFNEKLNWLKLNYHNPIMPQLADKYKVKQYVAEQIGEQYVVPNYGVWNRFEDIDFKSLPEEFVLKTTNDSPGVVVCRDKKTFDYEAARKHMELGMGRNYFYTFREWGYKDVERRIIADQFLDDGSGDQLLDYKFWCFNGKPKYMYITIKGKGIYENFYDMDFNIVDINHNFPRHKPEFEKPGSFELMKELAEKLAAGISLPFVRIDFFYVKGKIYFGEFTFYDWGGIRPFADYKQDLELGSLITLPKRADTL